MAKPSARRSRPHSQPKPRGTLLLRATPWGLHHPRPPEGCLLPGICRSLHTLQACPWPPSSTYPGSELTSQRRRTPLGSSHSPGSGRLPGGSASSEFLLPAAGKSCPSTTCREGAGEAGEARLPCPYASHPTLPGPHSSPETQEIQRHRLYPGRPRSCAVKGRSWAQSQHSGS